MKATQNDYINLYKQKVKTGTLNDYALQIGHLHNALGQVIKQLILMINTNNSDIKGQKQAQIPQIDYSKESKYQQQKFNYGINSKPVFKPFIKIENNSETQIDNISDKGVKSKESNDFDEIKERVEVFRRQEPIEKVSLDSYLANKSNIWDDEKQENSKKQIYRQGKKHNKSNKSLQGVECEMCQKFYGAFEGNSKYNKLCKHTSKHQTTAPYTKVRNFSQQFQDDL